MFRKAALIFALLILVTSIIFTGQTGMYSFAGSDPELAEITPIGDLNAEPPELKAKSAALYSLEMDKFVYAKNENEKISPYSITKILTCYLALEKLDPDKTVKVSANATKVYENGTSILLKTGEKMKVRDLIYGTLLESGNDAAYALGEAVSGSEKKFAKLMNKTVKKWGCEDTHFVNANGWKNKDHYTTAHDMTIIARNCFKNETLAKMSAAEEYTIPATNKSGERELGNVFLHSIDDKKGILCGKTGSWDEDDCSIALEFKKGNLSEVIVLLEDSKKGRRSDVKKLIEFSEIVTPGFLICDEGYIVKIAKVRHGEFTKVPLAVDGRTTAYPSTNKASDITVEIKADKLEAPISKGDKAGTYTVYANGVVVGKHGLVVTEDIKTGWFPSYLYISNRTTTIILEILAVIAVLLIMIILISRNMKKEKDGSGKTEKEKRVKKEKKEKYVAKH